MAQHSLEHIPSRPRPSEKPQLLAWGSLRSPGWASVAQKLPMVVTVKGREFGFNGEQELETEGVRRYALREGLFGCHPQQRQFTGMLAGQCPGLEARSPGCESAPVSDLLCDVGQFLSVSGLSKGNLKKRMRRGTDFHLVLLGQRLNGGRCAATGERSDPRRIKEP